MVHSRLLSIYDDVLAICYKHLVAMHFGNYACGCYAFRQLSMWLLCISVTKQVVARHVGN